MSYLPLVLDAAANRTSRAHVDVGTPAFSAAASSFARSESVSLIRSGRSLFGSPEMLFRPTVAPDGKDFVATLLTTRISWLQYNRSRGVIKSQERVEGAAMSAKAPAGGIVSVINGRYYSGGEFVPDHGRSCGRGEKPGMREEAGRIAAAIGWTLSQDDRGVWRAKSPTGGGESCPNLGPILARLRSEFRRRPGLSLGGPW